MTEIIQSFYVMLAQVWRDGVLDISVSRLMLALGVFLFFAALRGLFTRFVLRRLERITERTETEFDDLLRDAIEEPLKLLFLVMGVFFAEGTLGLTGLPAEIADKILRSLLAIVIFSTLHAALPPVFFGLRRIEELLSKEIVRWLMTIARWGIILTGAATVLQIWGIQIGPIIAGFGLFGVAVALGAQDLFKNLLGGVSILVERRFKIGDWVRVEGIVEGTVEDIGFRSTRIRRFDQVPVVVPNNFFADYALINFSEMNYRRIFWQIGVEYQTSSDQLRDICGRIRSWLEDNPNFISDDRVPCLIFVDGFNDSSIDIMVYCFTETTDWQAWLTQKQDLAYAIKEIVEGAGTGFAFPSRTIYHAQGSLPLAEIFEPPEG
jgi:MscS family membrane protein